jgi:hypothetical protein
LLNTFSGLGFSVAFSLLVLGSYLISQLFENPVNAESLGLLFAALLIGYGDHVVVLPAASVQEVTAPRLALASGSFLGTENTCGCSKQYRDASERDNGAVCPGAAAMWTARASPFSARWNSCTRNRREVALLQNQSVMQFMPSHNER